jgi:hypothetical protein
LTSPRFGFRGAVSPNITFMRQAIAHALRAWACCKPSFVSFHHAPGPIVSMQLLLRCFLQTRISKALDEFVPFSLRDRSALILGLWSAKITTIVVRLIIFTAVRVKYVRCRYCPVSLSRHGRCLKFRLLVKRMVSPSCS